MNTLKTISHRNLFVRNFFTNFTEIGAILPSSRYLGQAGAAYLARKQGPVAVLEVGAGTGSFTREILPHLTGGDSLSMVEINTGLIAALKHRFEHDPAFQTPSGVTLNFINADVRTLGPPTYDYIIFSLPLTNFPPRLVKEILSLMIDRLKPGGVFSYVKYAFIWRFKYQFGDWSVKNEMVANQIIIEDFAARYQIDQRLVWPNVPPTWVYYWQRM